MSDATIQAEVEKYFEPVDKEAFAAVRGDEVAYDGLWYEGPGQLFTAEDIEARNAAERKRNEDAMELIKADGFVRYPLFYNDLDGNPVELEAWLHPEFEPSNTEGFFERHGMHYNIYIPSYERAGDYGTMDVLDRFGVTNYYICVDPSQYAKYKEVYPVNRIVIRDINFRNPGIVDPVSSVKHPITMAGHAPLCNFTLTLSRSLGEDRFWFMDDDFTGLAMKARKGDEIMKADEVYDKDNFYRCSNILEEYGFNFKTFMQELEELSMKMRNPGFVGLEKFGTVFSLPVTWRRNTRVYSYYLTNNDTQVQHMGRQNNDVGTSIELTKHGMVNMLFEGISYNSAPTQAGGGQTEMYGKFGTYDKGKVISRMQPNTVKISYEYSRIHHSGNFTPLVNQRLVGAPIVSE